MPSTSPTSGVLSGNIGPLPNIRAALNSMRDEVRFELGGVPSGHFVYAVDDTKWPSDTAPARLGRHSPWH